MTKKATTLCLRWTAATAAAELIGLGSTFLVIGLLVSRINTASGFGILLSFVLTVLCGAIEASLVSFGQWWAMRPVFSLIRFANWWRATLIGALIGYILGYLPSTLMSIGESGAQSAAVEPPQWITLLLAAGLGLVAGAILSFAQWLVLRKHASKSLSWIPANMFAWMLGMPVIFQGMDLAFRMPNLAQSFLVISGALLLAGCVVGAVQGIFLAKILLSAERNMAE